MGNSNMHPCDFCKLSGNGYGNCIDCSFGFMDGVECRMYECTANYEGDCRFGVSGKCKARHQEDYIEEDDDETDRF